MNLCRFASIIYVLLFTINISVTVVTSYSATDLSDKWNIYFHGVAWYIIEHFITTSMWSDLQVNQRAFKYFSW